MARFTSPFRRALHAWTTRGIVAAVVAVSAALVLADPFPPYWNGGSGSAVHFAPVAWPATNDWTPYTKLSSDIQDRSTSDQSNGGTSPQSYVNVSSGCTDQTLPSVYYAYDAGTQVLFFRWRVQAPPHTYATGPNPGTFGATSPWSSALWTVFIDTNGDGYRDFAVHLDGSSGGPSAAVDRIAAIWSPTRSQSLDYVTNPQIHLISHNPTAFVDGPAASDRLLNFHGSVTPNAVWPNGAAETEWDYGTTRATKLNTGCGEYFIDYQIPLSMLDATAVGGPAVTPTTPMSLFFATANSLNNPLQKDVVVAGDFLADPSRPVPGGDTITPAGGTIAQPLVQSLTAVGCGTTTLTATVLDTIGDDGNSTLASVEFLAYPDTNGDGVANDSAAWSLVGTGAPTSTPGRYAATWNTAAAASGRYLVGVRATDAQGNVTYSYLDQAAVNAEVGTTPPNYANVTGLVVADFVNACGLPGASMSIAASPSAVGAGAPVILTVTVSNPSSQPLALSALTVSLPPGFTYQSTTGGTLSPVTSPTGGAGGDLPWTFAATSVPAQGTSTLIFTALASTAGGTYSTTASATVATGPVASAPAQIEVGSPSLTIAKSASVATASPGDPLTYTITYANDSAAGVTNAVITDVLPDGIEFVSASHGGMYAAGTRTVTWNVGAVAAGSGPFAVTLATTVASPYPTSAATPVVNTASIASTETSAANGSSAVYVNAPRASLRVQLSAPSTLVAFDTTLTYTLSYANVGQASAANTVLTLPVPAGWSFVSALNGGSHGAGTVTWSLGTLAAGASGSTQVTLRTGPAAYSGSNPSTATATITATGVTPFADPFTVGVTGLGNVCSTYYFRDTTANVGSAGPQRIANATPTVLADSGATATNSSPGSATEVELATFYQDPATSNQVDFNGQIASNMWVSRSGGAPAVVTGYVYDHNPANGSETLLGSASSTFNGNTITLFSFDVPVSGTLSAGHRLRWRYSFHSQNTNSNVTLSVLYGGGVSGTLRDSNSSFCVTAPATPVLDVQVAPGVVVPGDVLTWTIPFANTGATSMTSSTIAVTLPTGVAFTGGTLNGSPATPSGAGQVHTFTVASGVVAGTIAGGGSGTLVVTGTVTAPSALAVTSLTVSASLASTQTSPIVDTATAGLVLPALSVFKSVDDTLLGPGDVVTYTVDVLNGGLGSASGVVVSDVLPATAYYSYVPGSARLNGTPVTPDPVSAGLLTVNAGTLASGATARVTFQMQVAASGVPAGLEQRPNTAQVTNGTTAGTEVSNIAGITISTNPNLTLTKVSTPASGPIAPGDTITYALTVTNVGSAAALGVRIVDLVPGPTSFVSASMQHGGTLTDAPDSDAGTFDGAANRVVFEVGTLAPGAAETFVYDVVLASPMTAGSTTVGSTATATAANAGSRTASASIAAEAAPVLSLVKTAPASVPFPATTLAAGAAASTSITVVSAAGLTIGGTIVVDGVAAVVQGISGDTVTLSTAVSGVVGDPVRAAFEYRLDYANSGNADATGVVVADIVPAGLDVLAISAPGSVNSGTATWALGTIPSGAAGTLRLLVAPTAPGSYANQAGLASAELPPVMSNAVSTRAGSLVVSKSTTTPATAPGSGTFSVATYVITVENQDPSTTASGVTISDALPAGFAFESEDSLVGATAATSPAFGDTQPTWTGIDIAPASTVTLTFTARIGNVAPGTFQNEVTVSGGSLPVVGFDALATTAEDVTVASVLGTTGIPSITPAIVAGGTLSIGVADLDLDTDGSTVETVVVSVTNQRTTEQDDVTLTETGPATGMFTGTLATLDSPLGGTDFSAPLQVMAGDTVTVVYQDAFTGVGGSGTASASSTVMTPSGNTNPTANDDSATIAEDAADTAIDVMANDSTAPDTGETLSITAVTQGDNGGVVTITGGGTGLTYRPAANATAPETFTYTIDDGNGGIDTATVTVTITAGNDNPTAVNDTAVVNRTVPASLYVLGNDSFAPDTGETLTIVGVTQGSNGGTVAIGGSGDHVIYTAPANIGATDTFTYTIGDGNGGTDMATVTVTMNTAPTANADTASVAQDSSTNPIDVLANDSFAPDTGEFLFIYDVTAGSQGGVINITGCGTMIEYTPPPGFVGTETFIYTLRDSHGGFATALVTITVGDPNDPPTATDDTATVAEDSAATPIAVLGNDSIAPDTGETLSITAVTPGSQGGVVTITGGGTGLTYGPAVDFFGTETFTYTIADGRGGSDTATVTMTVTSVNDDPTAADDTAAVDRNAGATTISVLANDSTAPETGETLAIAAVTQGSHGGVVTITGGTTISYTPPAGFVGTETFTYTVDDGHGGTDVATVTVTITDPGAPYRRYFSEGLNNANTATHISLANPAQVARPVHLEFYRHSGPSITHDLTLGPRSRITIDTRTIAGLADAPFATAIEAEATVVAERTMSWDYGEPGTSLEHAVEASPTWYFAEGATTGPFTLFYLLMNPGTVPATATIDFLPQVGPPVQRTYVIAPHTRLTVPVNTVTPSLASADLGAAVHADQPIVVERSMYLSTPSTIWVAGTTGAGVTEPLTRWYFGEGSVGPFFDAWILLANPSTTPATAEVRYLSEDGRITVTTHTVPVGRRITIRVADDAPALFASSFGVVVTSTNAVPIIAERAMWWPNDGSGWYEGHVATGLPGTGHAWGIADGIAAPDGSSETYVLIANTSTRAGVVKVTTVFDDGSPALEQDIAIGREVRTTLRMRTFQPQVIGKRFSVFVEAQGPSPIDLVVEHSSYSNTAFVWGAGSSAPASPID